MLVWKADADVSRPCPAVIGSRHLRNIFLDRHSRDTDQSTTMPPSALRVRALRVTFVRANYHTTRKTLQKAQCKIDVDALLATPTWSLESLLPAKTSEPTSPAITSKQLHHLLRLSALPPPKSTEEESQMLATLSSQLHFVNEIRKIDASGVRPLQSLRDETAAGTKEAEIGIDHLKSAFENEELKGKYYQRIRRKQDAPAQGESSKTWDVLGAAQKKVGRFFVVDGGKDA